MDATDTRPTASAADRVYRHVRSAILSRRYADHELLAEGRLAEETGVSRTPVREALLRLEAEGMVRLLPKRGALVLPVSAQESRDVLDTRRLVETHCVQRILQAGRGGEVAAALAEPLLSLRRAATRSDLTAYVIADREFHACIVAAAGNQILNRLYGLLRDRQLRMGADNLLAGDGAADPRRMAMTMADHEEIAAAIGRGDLAESLRLTTDHLAHAALNLT